MTDSPTPKRQPTQNVIIQQAPKRNAIGLAGFILSLCSLLLGWLPGVGWITWVLGFLFSFVGIFSKPRGFAIAGLVISFAAIVFIVFVFAAVGLALDAAAAS